MNANWLPGTVLDELADDVVLVEALEQFDSRIVERGWTFDDEQSDEDFVIWFYPPSGAEVEDGTEPVTTVWMFAPEEGEAVHVVFVGTADDHVMTPDEFFGRIDAIEAYSSGDSFTP